MDEYESSDGGDQIVLSYPLPWRSAWMGAQRACAYAMTYAGHE
jgi:hypothetical protein